MRLSERAQFLVDNLDLPEAAQADNARWEYFQLAHLSDDSTFRIENKSRQIAASFTYAAEAVANALLYGTSSLFQSINLEEATEKIVYARRIYQNLLIGGKAKITKPDTTTSIGFDNGARILSIPGKPHRGKAKFWVYLDEWAHQQWDREIYTAALPIISKGGKLRGASSPIGASGIFWEIFTEAMQRYPGYSRKSSPWWETYAFCKNPKLARKLAPTMSTFERVDMFGNDRIKAIYANMLEEDFQQEYECGFIDESTAWIPWAVIKRNQQDDLLYFHAHSVDEALQSIESVRDAIHHGHIEMVLTGGIDIGRKKDLTEFMALGKSTTGQMPVRFMISLDRVEYDSQEHCFTEVIRQLPFSSVLVDQNGIGAQLAENLSRKTGIAQGVDFTNPTKELWAVQSKLEAERNNTPLPVDRDLAYQIHSIKKKVSAAKHNIFDTERNEKHHADKFWAWALAIYAGKSERVAMDDVPQSQSKQSRWQLDKAPAKGRWAI